MTRASAIVAVALLAAGCASGSRAPRCHMSGATMQWLEGSLMSWEVVRTRQLKLPAAPPPPLVVFDRYCVYSLSPGGSGDVRLRAGSDTLRGSGRPHGGGVALPNGLVIPVRGEAFASLLPGDSTTFLVLALEDVWQADPRHRGEQEHWPSFLRRTFIHEMTHARQLVTWAPMLRVAAGRVGLDDFDDDVIQQRFDTVPGFRSAVLAETRLLYEAADAASDAARAGLAREAVDRIRSRRTVAYGGVDAPWSRVEQLLLDMEGAAQWAAMSHVANASRMGAIARRDLLRGSRQFWSQEQGLALYMVLDALVPDWAFLMFSADPPSSLELIERALAGR